MCNKGNDRRERKKKRINAKLSLSNNIPCLTVFRSNTAVYCYLIDRMNNNVLAYISSRNIFKDSRNCNIAKATETGKKMGKKIKDLNIESIVFNRNGFLYHGKIKALAEGVRSFGIKF